MYYCGLMEARRLRAAFGLIGVSLVLLWTLFQTSRTAYDSSWSFEEDPPSLSAPDSFGQRHLLSVNFSLKTANEIEGVRRGREALFFHTMYPINLFHSLISFVFCLFVIRILQPEMVRFLDYEPQKSKLAISL